MGYTKDDRLRDALETVVEKQDDQGRWLLEMGFNGRMQTNMEARGKPSKWVTLNALRVLKRVYGE